MSNSTTPIAGLLVLLLALTLPCVIALCCRPSKGSAPSPVRRWFFRNIWLFVPLAMAMLLLVGTLLGGETLRKGYDNQIALIGVVLPLGLSVVLTNLSHGKAGRKFAVLGMLLALLACGVLLVLPSEINGRRLTYDCLTMGYIGTMPLVIPLVAVSTLQVLVSGCISLFGKDRPPVSTLKFGRLLLRTLPLLVTAGAIVLSVAFMYSEFDVIRNRIWFQHLWIFPMFLPMVLSVMFINASHQTGSKGAAVWGIFCAMVHALAGLYLYHYVENKYAIEGIAAGLAVFSAAAAVAELACALMALFMKRPALPAAAAPETAAVPAAMPVTEAAPASSAVLAASVAAAVPAAPGTAAAPAAPVVAADPAIAAMQEEIARLREQLASKDAAEKAPAAPAAPKLTDRLNKLSQSVQDGASRLSQQFAQTTQTAPTPVAAAPASQGIPPIVSYPYEPADLQPAAAPAIAPDLAEQIGNLTQLLNQGVLDSAAYEAAVKRLTGEASGAGKTRPQRIYEDFIRNHVAYAYKSPAGVTFEPLREDMICIEPIKLLTGLKYQDLTVRMIKTHVDAPNSYGTMLRQNVCIVIDDDFNPILVLSPQTGIGAVMNGVQTYTKLAGVKA